MTTTETATQMTDEEMEAADTIAPPPKTNGNKRKPSGKRKPAKKGTAKKPTAKHGKRKSASSKRSAGKRMRTSSGKRRAKSGKASKSTVKTTTRSGKTIHRAKAGGKGVLASKGLHLMVVRVPPALHSKLWKRAKAKEISMQSLVISALEKVA